MVTVKFCRRCKKERSISEFNKSSPAKDGLQKYCRECTKGFSRQNKERKAEKFGREIMPYKEKFFSAVSDEELLQHIRDFYVKNGRPPSTADFEGNPKYPHSKTFYRHFKYRISSENKLNSWNDIIILAGLTPLDYELIWTAWQYLVERAAEVLEGKCLFQYTGLVKGFKPDIYIPFKHKVIDAATSNYDRKHKVHQYECSISVGASVEYWCLYKVSENGINKPNLKYIFSDDIICRLEEIGENEISDSIKSLLHRNDEYAKSIIEHRKSYVIERLTELYQLLGRTPQTRDLINNPMFPSATTVTTLFGSFNNGLIAANIPVQFEANRPFDREIAINDIINFTKKLGRIPSTREIGPPNTTFAYKVYYKYFNGIEECLKSQGINIGNLKNSQVEINKNEIVKQFLEFKKFNGRYPKQQELRNENKLPSPHWVRDNCGGLEQFIKLLEKLEKAPTFLE